MAVSAGKLISVLEKLAPVQVQTEWDNSGLQAGDRRWSADKILLTLDVTTDVVRYAADNGLNFILAHHPLIFRKLSRIDGATPLGRTIVMALDKRISIYAMHTNLDVIRGGVSDALAAQLNLTDVEILERQKGDYYKLAVYVPVPYLDKVRKAVGDAGAGWIGKYSHCSFAAPGAGMFRPGAGANPWLGSEGRIEEVEEYKLETLVEGFRLPDVLAAMKSAHPYEEVAYDLLPMSREAEYGLGRIGLLPQPMSLLELASSLGNSLGCSALRVSGDLDAPVRKVAVCGGSGSNLITTAYRRGADVLATGDISYHSALEARELGLALIDPGHYSSEYPVLAVLGDYIKKELPKEVVTVRFPGSTDPLRILSVQSE